jgi:hypothetical protein
MILALSPEQSALHERALQLCHEHRVVEWRLIEVIGEIDRTKLYKKLGVSSLFQYAVQLLGLSEPVAYGFISVTRKVQIVPSLGEEIRIERLTVAKASRFVSALTVENGSELIAFAQNHSIRELDFEVARRNPKKDVGESARPISEDRVSLKLTISRQTLCGLKRVRLLIGAGQSQLPTMEQALDAMVELYLAKNDPLEKARRAVAIRNAEEDGVKKAKPSELCAHRVPRKRIPLAAREKHEVVARDGARCTFRNSQGDRCGNERWLEIHHLKAVSHGGTNDPQNLATLCGFHHDLVHQLKLPLGG